MNWKDKVGTQTLAKVKDNSKISAVRFHELLYEYLLEVGSPIIPPSLSDYKIQLFHRERFCDLLGQKGVKLDFAIKGRNRVYDREKDSIVGLEE